MLTLLSQTAENASDLVGNGTSFWRNVYGPQDDESLTTASGLGKVVVTVFGSASDAEADPFGAATCLLVNTAEEGTVDPNEEGAASGFAAFAGWAALTGAAVAYQLL